MSSFLWKLRKMGYPFITLNTCELEIVKLIAENRKRFNDRTGARETNYGDLDPAHKELNQFGAELAFCKITNCYPDLNWTGRIHYDAVSPNGKTIDIKTTNILSGHLLVKQKPRRNLPFFYALMLGELPYFALAGFMRAWDLLDEDRLDNTLEHPAYKARQDELFMPEGILIRKDTY